MTCRVFMPSQYHIPANYVDICRLPSATGQGYASVMAETKDPHRERIEDLGRMNTIYSERPWHDWKPGKPPKHDNFTHDVPRQVDDEHPDKPDRD